jgi:hypothetical protein
MQPGILLVVTYLLANNPVYSQGTPAVLHCSRNGHLDVYSRSERSSPVIAKVKCGDRLFVIEQRFRYPYVRTEGGKDGFILSPNHGQWSIDPEPGPPKDSVATPPGTGRTGKQPLIGPNSAAKSEESAGRTVNKSLSAASSAAAPVAALRSSEREGTSDLPDKRTQQQPEVIQQPTNVTVNVNACGTTVSGIVTVSANVTSNVGIAGVQSQLDGANFGPQLTTSPYSLTWDTTTATNGCHVISTAAQDLNGNTGTTTANVFVNNPDKVR